MAQVQSVTDRGPGLDVGAAFEAGLGGSVGAGGGEADLEILRVAEQLQLDLRAKLLKDEDMNHKINTLRTRT